MFKHRLLQRCHELALLGRGKVSPNPMVGAVIVHENRIIGEGWHQSYGEAHAEINALNSVKKCDRYLLNSSILYVSLEPCSIHGNTPPCTTAIKDAGIKKVIIAARDLTAGVHRVSQSLLNNFGIKTEYEHSSPTSSYITAARNTLVSRNRPYVILKWAQSSDGFIGKPNKEIGISNAYTKRYTHQLRSASDAIIVGRKTFEADAPQLNVRHYFGKDPQKIIFASKLSSRQDVSILKEKGYIIIVHDPGYEDNLEHVYNHREYPFNLSTILSNLARRHISNVLVEGGASTLQSFIDAGLWDEARIITAPKSLGSGIKSPVLNGDNRVQHFRIVNDDISVFFNNSHPFFHS